MMHCQTQEKSPSARIRGGRDTVPHIPRYVRVGVRIRVSVRVRVKVSVASGSGFGLALGFSSRYI